MKDSLDIQSSSSSFEFSITQSSSSNQPLPQLCPADELFYKGQLLPLHLSPRLSLVRTLLLSSSSSSNSCSDSTSITASRDSNGSSSSADSLGLLPDSSRPSSATQEDCSTTNRRFRFRFPSFFLNNKNPILKKNPKEIIRKYLEKVKPLIEKLSSLQLKNALQQKKKSFSVRRTRGRTEILSSSLKFSQSLDENYMRSPYRRKRAVSCPSSMRSSPSHSRLLSSDLMSSSSSMEELQSAIQAAIAHCKSTMAKQKKSLTGGNGLEEDICVF